MSDSTGDQDRTQYSGAAASGGREFTAGDIIGGDYEVLSFIGAGGMGNVYKVRHKILQTEYALKTLSADQVTDVAWRRFQVEAQAIARLNHPNIVGIYNLGLHDNRVPYYVMDILTGKTLLEVLQMKSHLETDEALKIFIEVCAGIGFAHKKGIVHRDIKPGNIFVLDKADAAGATVKIVDFGIAKLSHTKELANQQLTGIGEICGSPFYMSPEQCQAGKIDARSDTYSLGCTLFEALTSSPPFKGRNAMETMLLHGTAPAPTLKAACGRSFPPALESALAKAMAKAPMDRYQTTESLAQDLNAILQHGTKPSQKAHQSRKIPAVAGGLLLTAVLATIAIVLQSKKPSPTATSLATAGGAPAIIKAAPVDDTRSAKTPASARDKTPYSTIDMNAPGGRPTIQFNFPEDVNLGLMASLTSLRQTYPCQGKTKPMLLGSCVYFPGVVVLEHPEYIDRFRSGDLFAVHVDASGPSAAETDKFENSTFKHFLHIASLVHVSLIECSKIDDGIVDDLEKLPNLHMLELQDSNITMHRLATSPLLKRLSHLTINTLDNVSEVLAALKGSKNLILLDLQNTRLHTAQIKEIAEMPALQCLRCAGTRLTDSDLQILSKLKNLRLIHCPATQVTSKADPRMTQLLDSKSSPSGKATPSQPSEEERAMQDFLPSAPTK
ncbi:MAG: protein kinase [Cyanobacteria bacterium SZAS LIN-3]|nr:protein kinase [Cyanobacteria bacterium SZAS LIN-3]